MRGVEILEHEEVGEAFEVEKGAAFDEIPEELDELDTNTDEAEESEERSTELDLTYDKNTSETDPTLRLVREVGQNQPLLTAHQEKELGEIIQLGQPAQERIDAGSVVIPYASWSMVGQMADARHKAVNKMCMANVRWLRVIAKRMAKNERGMTEEECFQAGFPGLHRAAEKFDPWRGNKFSTYSQPWIVQAIQRAPQNREIIKEPVAFYNDGTLPKYAKLTAQGLSPREIAGVLELNDTAMQDLHMAYMLRYVKSFDQPAEAAEGKSLALYDVIPDRHIERELDYIFNPALRELVEILKKALRPNELEVLVKAGGDSTMETTERRRLERTQALVTHPSLQRVVREVAGVENPWDGANCTDVPELFLRDSKVSRQVIQQCIECPLLEACQELTEKEQPSQGVWAGMQRSSKRIRGVRIGYNADSIPLRLEQTAG
jgi:DNA-directed RNA polymerase sigma subunit (sigma70/sigma32)